MYRISLEGAVSKFLKVYVRRAGVHWASLDNVFKTKSSASQLIHDGRHED